MEFRGFSSRQLIHGEMFDASETMYPSKMIGFSQHGLELNTTTSNYFGIVLEGPMTLVRPGLPEMELVRGMYFSATGPFKLRGSGRGLVIERMGYRGLFTVGGPAERFGRLCYMNNCSTSQLVPPARVGDPTLQLLVFPPNTVQTMHIHPTLRMGVVFEGRGDCVMQDGSKIPLRPGEVFMLNERFPHCFCTDEEGMSVFAYHPDTDLGPTDELHPMRSRTYVRD